MIGWFTEHAGLVLDDNTNTLGTAPDVADRTFNLSSTELVIQGVVQYVESGSLKLKLVFTSSTNNLNTSFGNLAKLTISTLSGSVWFSKNIRDTNANYGVNGYNTRSTSGTSITIDSDTVYRFEAVWDLSADIATGVDSNAARVRLIASENYSFSLGT